MLYIICIRMCTSTFRDLWFQDEVELLTSERSWQWRPACCWWAPSHRVHARHEQQVQCWAWSAVFALPQLEDVLWVLVQSCRFSKLAVPWAALLFLGMLVADVYVFAYYPHFKRILLFQISLFRQGPWEERFGYNWMARRKGSPLMIDAVFWHASLPLYNTTCHTNLLVILLIWTLIMSTQMMKQFYYKCLAKKVSTLFPDQHIAATPPVQESNDSARSWTRKHETHSRSVSGVCSKIMQIFPNELARWAQRCHSRIWVIRPLSHLDAWLRAENCHQRRL